jgi:hypothetical protein
MKNSDGYRNRFMRTDAHNRLMRTDIVTAGSIAVQSLKERP